jgi:hypothetical protein
VPSPCPQGRTTRGNSSTSTPLEAATHRHNGRSTNVRCSRRRRFPGCEREFDSRHPLHDEGPGRRPGPFCCAQSSVVPCQSRARTPVRLLLPGSGPRRPYGGVQPADGASSCRSSSEDRRRPSPRPVRRGPWCLGAWTRIPSMPTASRPCATSAEGAAPEGRALFPNVPGSPSHRYGRPAGGGSGVGSRCADRVGG